MEHTKHIWRAALILAFLLLVFITARHFLIPVSFGQVGHYRYDSLKEFMSPPVIHGGKESCEKCHKELYAAQGKGKHASLSCEVCHGPLAGHAKDGQKTGEMPKDPSYALCAYCHQKLAGRPEKFPQVAFRAHLQEQGFPADAKIPQKVCVKCHEPHNPKK